MNGGAQCGKEEKLEKEVTRLLSAGVQGRVFPGAAAALTWRRGDELFSVLASSGTLGDGCGPAESCSLYDLASITKSFVSVAALRMAEANTLDLSLPAAEFLPDIRGSCLGEVSLLSLLEHRGGVDSWGGLYLDAPLPYGGAAARRWIVGEAARRPADEPGPIYSDLGYILAGEALARHSATTLDLTLRKWVTEPLGLACGIFFAGEPAKRSLLRRAAATEQCAWRGRMIRGEVHDENCAALGGIAGHAGLFGKAESLGRFGLEMLDVLGGRSSFLSQQTFQNALAVREDRHTLRLGWDTVSLGKSSAGSLISKSSFGHLGFTGTSLWCDPERGLSIALLSNRVHPSRSNERIKHYRPAFHDGVFRAFDCVIGRD